MQFTAYIENCFQWRVEPDGNVTIIGYTGTSGIIEIPRDINGMTVTKIGDYAFADVFEDNGILSSVIIPDTVTTIGKNAFTYNIISNVYIPNSVTTIGENAFAYNRLTSVIIPESVTTIKDYAFAKNNLTVVNIHRNIKTIGKGVFVRNSNLTEINVDFDNENYISIDGALYNKNGTNLIQWPGGKTENIIIPDNVTTIGVSAFLDMNLTSIIIPNSVNYIEENAFSINQLTSINIPNSVRIIANGAFSRNLLNNITIPDNVTIIGNFAFFANENITNIIIGNGVTKIGERTFTSRNIISIIIGANVTLQDGWWDIWEFDHRFDEAYFNSGRQAGTYTRTGADSTIWIRR